MASRPCSYLLLALSRHDSRGSCCPVRHDSAPDVPILRDHNPVTGDTNGLSSPLSRLKPASCNKHPQAVTSMYHVCFKTQGQCPRAPKACQKGKLQTQLRRKLRDTHVSSAGSHSAHNYQLDLSECPMEDGWAITFRLVRSMLHHPRTREQLARRPPTSWRRKRQKLAN